MWCSLRFPCKMMFHPLLHHSLVEGHVVLILFVFFDVLWCPTRFLYMKGFATVSSNTTNTNSGAESGYPSRAHEFNPGFVCVSSVLLVIICVFVFFFRHVTHWLSFDIWCPITPFVSSSKIYRPPSRINENKCRIVFFDALSSCSIIMRVMIGNHS
jgi:hypothetical protein